MHTESMTYEELADAFAALQAKVEGLEKERDTERRLLDEAVKVNERAIDAAEASEARASTYRALLVKVGEGLEPFAEAVRNAEISGSPPFTFTGAADYERASTLLQEIRAELEQEDSSSCAEGAGSASPAPPSCGSSLEGER